MIKKMMATKSSLFTKKGLISNLEKAFVVISLFFLTRPLYQYMIIGGVDLQYSIILGSMCVVIIYLISRLPRAIWLFTRSKSLMVVVFFVFLSVGWAVNIESTISSILIFVGATLIGFYLAMRYSIFQQMKLLVWLFILIAILSILIAIVYPSIGTHPTPGGVSLPGLSLGKIALTGLWEKKNRLGRHMAESILLISILLIEEKKNLWLWGSLVLSIGVLFLTQSATPLVSIVLILGMLIPRFFKRFQMKNTKEIKLFIVILILVLVLCIFVLNWHEILLDNLLLTMGRNPEQNSLSTRVALWKNVISIFQQRPFLGHGFGERPVTVELTYSTWVAGQTHNGYLEILLQLGIIGLVLFLINLTVNFKNAYILSIISRNSWDIWPLAYLTLLALFKGMESIFLGRLSTPWTIYVMITYSLHKMLSRKSDHTMILNQIKS